MILQWHSPGHFCLTPKELKELLQGKSRLLCNKKRHGGRLVDTAEGP